MNPLTPVSDLAERLSAEDLRIVDCRWYLDEPDRGRAAYNAGHIPGAVYFSLDDDLAGGDGPGRHPLPDTKTWVQLLGQRGIARRHRVVGYDDRGGAVAARLWWMLDAIGHPDVTVLDGGIDAWTAGGHPLTAEPTHWTPVVYGDPGKPAFAPTIDRYRLRADLGEVLLVDARAPERYLGLEEPIDPVAGHIPTAHNAHYEGNLAADGRFRDAAELRRRYAMIGADERPVVVYCGSGVTACHNLLAMRIAGLEGTLYPGSWSDWSTAGYSVAVGLETDGPGSH